MNTTICLINNYPPLLMTCESNSVFASKLWKNVPHDTHKITLIPNFITSKEDVCSWDHAYLNTLVVGSLPILDATSLDASAKIVNIFL